MRNIAETVHKDEKLIHRKIKKLRPEKESIKKRLTRRTIRKVITNKQAFEK
jgi:hypothetical protein